MPFNNIDCNNTENMIAKFEAASTELFVVPIDADTVDVKLLNRNTKILNEEIQRLRDTRNQVQTGKLISSNTKNIFGVRFVPENLRKDYNDSVISDAAALIRYMKDNSTFFSSNFTKSENILSKLSEIEPQTFKPFSSEYPSIEIRLRTGLISSAETFQFIRENSFNHAFFEQQTRSNSIGIISLFDRFLSGLGIGIGLMGSFCALVENVFALVNGQSDTFNNSEEFGPELQVIISGLNPRLTDVLGQVANISTLLTKALQDTGSVRENLQNSFNLLAGVFGITMNFFDSSSNTGGTLEIDWNLNAIKNAIQEEDILFTTILESTQKPLGDINQDGVVNNTDVVAFQIYIDGNATDVINDYVNNIMLQHMTENASQFSEYINFSGADESDGLSELVSEFSTVVSLFGSPADAETGDFGLADILQMIGLISGISSSIQALTGGSRPVNISALIGQLDQALELATKTRQKLNSDFSALSVEYKNATEETLAEAESISVADPAKTAEISEKNQESLENNYTPALQTLGETNKDLGPTLTRQINQLKGSLGSLAAVGVLDNVETQLEGVIDQSAVQLKSKIGMFGPAALDNGIGFNMGSAYSKNAGLVAGAQESASDEATQQMKNIMKGQIAMSAEKYRDRKKEEVEFVALRFCKLAGEIERIYNEVTSPLETMQGQYQQTDRLLSASGNENSLKAINAGATRFDTETRIAAMREAGIVPATIARGGITGLAPGSPPYVGRGPAADLPAGFVFPSYEDARQGRGGILYAPGPSSNLSGRAGFLPRSQDGGVDTQSLYMLYQLAQRWGQTIRINSAYRSPRANAAARGKPGLDSGGYHPAGKAFDCSISGRQNQITFMNLAYQIGFRGFGSYNTFTHIDTRGSAASWGNFRYYNLSGPAGAKGN